MTKKLFHKDVDEEALPKIKLANKQDSTPGRRKRVQKSEYEIIVGRQVIDFSNRDLNPEELKSHSTLIPAEASY